MRVNIYAEEMTDRIEIISKEIDGHTFTGLRLYLELPVTHNGKNVRGPFIHRPGDDDSAAITFWGKRNLRDVLAKMSTMLDAHYGETGASETAIRARALEEAAAAVEHADRKGREWVPGSLWDALAREGAARIRALAAAPQAPVEAKEAAPTTAREAGTAPSGWEALFDRVALELSCLPSAFVNGNDHVFAAIKKLQEAAAQAGAALTDDDILAIWASTPNTGDMRIDLKVFARALLAAHPSAAVADHVACDRAPAGHQCTREKGHSGPSAAHPAGVVDELRQSIGATLSAKLYELMDNGKQAFDACDAYNIDMLLDEIMPAIERHRAGEQP